MNNVIFIIEAPNKCEKIAQITGGKVYATKGHFKQLTEENWIDLQTYKPQFDFMKDKQKNIEFFVRECRDKEVYIATDPDREGYAIGYFFYELVKNLAKSVKRVEFHEITATGIQEGLKKAIPFNQTNFAMFEAFKGRAVGDKLVGWIMSPKLSKMMEERGLSVGRVQTPALHLIVERELEIRDFENKPEEEKITYKASPVIELGGKERVLNTDKRFKKKEEAEEEYRLLFDAKTAIIDKIEKKEIKRNPKKPFQAVTLIQTANKVYGFSSEKTMNLAQNLYEKGLISYHRTDAENLSKEFLEEVKNFLKNEEWYFYTEYKAGSQSQAEAHEAIRITHCHLYEEIQNIIQKENLTEDHEKLYSLIWENSVYSQSKPKINEVSDITFVIKSVPFKLSITREIYSSYGSDKNQDEEDKETLLLNIKEGDEFLLKKFEIVQVKADAPNRFKESDFIPLLQKEGIGRPSTYASFIPKLLERKYIEICKKKNKKGKETEEIIPTEKGIQVIKILKDSGDEWITESSFTQEMENILDSIIKKEKEYIDFIKTLHQKMGGEEFSQQKIIAKPSEKQIKLIEEMSERLNIEIPKETYENMNIASQWLNKAFNENKKTLKPSEKQIQFAEKLANEKNLELPNEYKNNLEICKKFIDKALKEKLSEK